METVLYFSGTLPSDGAGNMSSKMNEISLGPRSAKTSVLRVVCTTPERFEANETRILDTGISVLGMGPSTILCVTGAGGTDDASPLRCRFTVFHNTGSRPEDINIEAKITNVSDRVITAPTETITLHVFSLPLVSAHVVPIHVFSTSSSSENLQNLDPSRPQRHEPARISLKKTGSIWTVRALVKKIRWEKRPAPHLSNGYAFTASLTLDTRLVPLDRIDSLRQQMCSDPNTHILKAEILDRDARYSRMLRVYIRNLTHLGPPRDLLLQFCLYADVAPIIMRHNPEPFMRQRTDNGFTVLSPKTIMLHRGQRTTLLFKNGYSSRREFSAIFFPADIPQLDISAGVWRPKADLKINVLALHPYHLKEFNEIGTVHFFAEEALIPTPGMITVPSAQLDVRTEVRDEDDEDESHDSDSDFETTEGVLDDGVDTSMGLDSEESDRSETPPILKQARSRYAGLKMSASDDSNSDYEDEERHDRSEKTIHWIPWRINIPVNIMPPLAFTKREGTGTPTAAETEWTDISERIRVAGRWRPLPPPISIPVQQTKKKEPLLLRH